MTEITCIPLDGFPKAIAAELAQRLAKMLKATVVISDGVKTLDHAFDPHKRQYDSSMILSLLSGITVDSTNLVLGVTQNDLFSHFYSSVFGAAAYAGRIAVVSGSQFSLRNRSLNAHNGLFYDRLVKESMHELGHAQGLDHCIDPYCVMHKSFCVRDIDEKTQSYCSICRRELKTTYKYTRFLKPIS